MKINVDITRGDLVWSNLLVAHRIPGNWSFVTFIGLGYFGTYLYRHGLSQGANAVIGMLGESLFAAIVAFVLLLFLDD